MSKYTDIVISALGVVSGIVFVLISDSAFKTPAGILYQITIGVVLIFTSGQAISIGFDCKSLLIPDSVYAWVGGATCLIGLIVLFNFDRYGEVIRDHGLWPIYALGALEIFNGSITLVHYLTVFDRPVEQPSKT